MKPAIVLSFFILIVAFTLVGCGADEKSRLEYNFKQGVAEVRLNLLENAPPENIYPHSEFNIVVEVENQAAYDVNNGELKIIGLDEQYFDIYPFSQRFNLLGRSLTNPAGEKTFLEFSGTTGGLFENAVEYVGNYFLKISYDSSLDFTDTVCINTDYYAVYDAGCDIEERKTYSGQGAPLAVKELEEIISPGSRSEAEFRFTLENKGKGTVKEVTLVKAQLGGEELTCNFRGEDEQTLRIEFDERQQEILICKRSLRSQSSYETTLLLNLRYNYEFKEQQKLQLVR